VDLPGGSYLCTLEHPDHVSVRLPVRIDRDGAWEQEVTLYRPGEVPEGFLPVPGGPYRSGEEREGVGWREELRTQDLFVSRVPVTVADYVAFLDDLGPEEARRRQPRDGELRFLVEDAGRWRCPRPGEAPPLVLGPLHPVVGVSWLDALAHAAWRSRREGRLYRLMHEGEVEKAARGVDARNFPWGDHYDGSFSNTSISWPEGPHPVPVGGFPVDESPYGVRDMAGNACTWCLNAGPEPYRHYRIFRGGAWCLVPSFAMCAYRGGNLPSSVGRGAGIRLACSPLAAWGPGR
jgi:serine/threonine-protein kinase